MANKDLLAWLLIGSRRGCQPIRCQIWKYLLTIIDFKKVLRETLTAMIFIYFFCRECSRLSNWFSLRCLGPWINSLEWWSAPRFMFLNDSPCVSLVLWRVIIYSFLAFITVLLQFSETFESKCKYFRPGNWKIKIDNFDCQKSVRS